LRKTADVDWDFFLAKIAILAGERTCSSVPRATMTGLARRMIPIFGRSDAPAPGSQRLGGRRAAEMLCSLCPPLAWDSHANWPTRRRPAGCGDLGRAYVVSLILVCVDLGCEPGHAPQHSSRIISSGSFTSSVSAEHSVLGFERNTDLTIVNTYV
jgi:hypothetical protein